MTGEAVFCSDGSDGCSLFSVYLEYPVVERDHDEAGDVEGAERGVNDEVRVIEGTDERLSLIQNWLTDSQTCVVEAQRLIYLTRIISC